MSLMLWQMLDTRLRWLVPIWASCLLFASSTWDVNVPVMWLLLGLQMGLIKHNEVKQSWVILIGLALLPVMVFWPLWSLMALMSITLLALFSRTWQALAQNQRLQFIPEFVVLLLLGIVTLSNLSFWYAWVLALTWVCLFVLKTDKTGSQKTTSWPAAIDEIQHNERQRIYRNIHDEVGATMLQLIYQLDGHAAQDQAKQVMQKIRQSVAKTTQFSLTVADLFHDLCLESKARLAEAGIDFESDSDIIVRENLAPLLPMNITRIAREAISNIIRHAQASKVYMSVVWHTDQKTWVITDDGVGLIHKGKQGKGLKSMAQRANKMGAQLTWETHKQGGTSLVLRWQDES